MSGCKYRLLDEKMLNKAIRLLKALNFFYPYVSKE